MEKRIAINTQTQQEHDALMRWYESKGLLWTSGELPTLKPEYWEREKEYTYVRVENGSILKGNICWLTGSGIEVMPFAQFAEENSIEY